MKIGDKLYYVNSGREIDTYKIDSIDSNDTVHISSVEDDEPIIKTSFNMNNFRTIGKMPRLFEKYDDALHFKQQLDNEYEKKRQAMFDEILEEALNSVTLDAVEKHGILLKEKKTEYEPLYSDAPGGMWFEAKLYMYNGKYYIVAYRCTDGETETKECIKFSERN